MGMKLQIYSWLAAGFSCVVLTAYQGGVEGLGVLEVGQLAGDHLSQSCSVSLLHQLQQGVASKLDYTTREITYGNCEYM